MRLLLWIALTGALAVVGAMTLPLLAGVLLIACSDTHHCARRRRRQSRPGHNPTPAGYPLVC
ncbi:hypothetical protein GCM10022243_29870 [Saccharothrix violaceirubra]|uniref:Uncharacterized protein n=1 Tax=Saccharothrix violaceirubra TaxID=413306 RepID=A0A7W7T5F5_9PSEU|nr:hypothetical protein [Saccharothrix violaceirubra]MBB4966611.1 hypothetical protein [Saccharothrix violaceirubra]